jgi:LAO/AO transport system kinase
MEIADVFVINKADRPGVADTRRDLEQMLELSAGRDWRPPIVATVSTSGDGVGELWSALAEHHRWLVSSGELERRRRQRVGTELRAIVAERLMERARSIGADDEFDALRDAVMRREIDPWSASDRLLG